MTDSVYWIWLQLLFGIGTRRAELLMDYFEHPKDIYEGVAAGNRVAGMLEPGERSAVQPAMQRAAEIERRTLKKGCEILTPAHPDYPPLLRSVYDRPAALYVRGDLGCLKDTLAIAMVGTRKHTEYGRAAAILLAGELARQGAVVVSGLAPGIDAECHRAALEAGGKTVGVLGCGLDIDYPKQNRALKTAMSGSGAVVTEFPLGTEPYPSHFPLRNRIISGMSHGTAVVEADQRSGSLITARLAREQGRQVFAVPGSIFEEGGRGPHHLIRQGARLIDSAEDILHAYPEFSRRPPRSAPRAVPEVPRPAPPVPAPPEKARPLPDGVTGPAAQVYAAFGRDTITVDELASGTALAAGEILSALTELELYGVIESYPGRRFGLK